jgi:hypothetical protein
VHKDFLIVHDQDPYRHGRLLDLDYTTAGQIFIIRHCVV